MKTIFFTLSILAAFGMFCIVGYQIAAHSDSQALLPKNPQTTGTINAQQSNLVLVQVDQIGHPKPVLRAVWQIIRFHSDNQTVLNFSKIYPDPKPTVNAEIENAFSLGPKSEPSANFFQKITDGKIKQNGYILIDDAGFTQMAEWLHSQNYSAGENDLSSELQSGCTYLASPKNPKAPAFDWGAFMSHASSNIRFNDILAEWNLLASAQPATRCVFSAQ